MINWRKSSRSGGGNDDACVELAESGGRLWVRDSKDPEGARLVLVRESFAGLLERVKSDDLDPPHPGRR
ncbi:DUF397 domain-containing protein [Actinomadura madurae]|uniref:DUF397 domain-containing protein n=1 Tax=Actinomadura madurae TaxID=1993 RepID=UPI0020274BE5|nr:DUF397 domain-containing protein [Actinomadura madurae]URM95656.1 DUF397 domain-containing protein [Actinomadura madurae]URN06356.1 DUF397 domain-containing protein [Actinomadura madurae]